MVHTPVPPRGIFLLDRAIAKRWEEARLEEYFRAYWPDTSEAGRTSPLNFMEARPETPHPYVCYSRSTTPTILGHSTGARSTLEDVQYLETTIQFNIHAVEVGTRDAESLAAELMLRMKAAYDPGTPKLNIAPDAHDVTIADGDYLIREGDEEWMAVLMYRIRFEAYFNHCLANVPILEMPAGAVPAGGDPEIAEAEVGIDPVLQENTGQEQPSQVILIGGVDQPAEFVAPPYVSEPLGGATTTPDSDPLPTIGDAATLQTRLAQAASGDVLTLSAGATITTGMYFDIPAGVTITTQASNPAKIVWDGLAAPGTGATAALFDMSSAVGSRIENVVFEAPASGDAFAGIYAAEAAGAVIYNCRFTDFRRSGGARVVSGTAGTMTGFSIKGCTATRCYYGFSTLAGGSFGSYLVEDCIVENSVSHGYHDNHGITSSIYRRNQFKAGELTVGSGISTQGTASFVISNNDIDLGASDEGLHGIHVEMVSAATLKQIVGSITDNHITNIGNTSDANPREGILVRGDSSGIPSTSTVTCDIGAGNHVDWTTANTVRRGLYYRSPKGDSFDISVAGLSVLPTFALRN